MSAPISLNVQLSDRSYPIFIGAGLLTHAEQLTTVLSARKIALITNTIVAPLYADLVIQVAKQKGVQVIEIVLPDGEINKSLKTIAHIIDVLVANQMGRDDLIVALGGGVVGDMAGFVAACFQRGIGYIQIPTTLLSQVDSSVGGKTGVNHSGGKNLIGAFHQPKAVIIDTSVLRSLPLRELRAGMAEIIKYGMICDISFFCWLEQNVEKLLALESATLAHAIHRSCQIKAGIVARDEHEHGDRALLNFGHTFGHAIETVTAYSTWLHGEAVGAGMMMAATMSLHVGSLSVLDVERLAALLKRFDLRTDAREEVTANAAKEAMSRDKKVKAGKQRFILLRGIGEAYITADYPPAALEATLAAHLG